MSGSAEASGLSSVETVFRAFRLNMLGSIDSVEIICVADNRSNAITAALPNGHGVDLWHRAPFLELFPPLVAALQD